MPSNLEKAVIGAAGAIGTGVLAWQTQFPWIKYDIQLIKVGAKLVKRRQERYNTFVIDKFEEHASVHPQKTMVIYQDSVYTYEFMEQQANRVANVAQRLGLKFGDVVAIVIHNEPAFVWTLLGLQKLGISVAMINFNLRLKHLSHSILAAEPKACIVGAGEELQEAVSEIVQDLGALPLYAQGLPLFQEPLGMQNFDALMMQALPVQPHHSVRDGMTHDTIMCFIYTSGTTGLPKPACISQLKGTTFGFVMELIDYHHDDVIYICLPLYHSSGGGLGLFTVIETGSTMVLKDKFSASHFWPDCRKYNVTVIQYIGEIFRYILAQPPHELDSVHKVRGAFGNGLRKDIFEAVQKRFKIPHLCEFYGSTEGVSALFNIANKPGAVGRISPFLNWLDPDPKVLVKYDMATAMPIRDRNGRCIKIKPGETGLFISKVPDFLISNGSLTIYKASQEANEKKFVHDAFKDGDLYFNSGDVMYLDRDYFVYFNDRIGDTFRWKGENVSTTEVANMLSTFDFILDANVYGVTVPGHDGRAGMAALSLQDGEKLTPERLKKIFKLCEVDLPMYARPLFLRVLQEAVLTCTFKQRKVELRDEGYDMSKVKDDLYYLDTKAATYSPLTHEGLVSFLHSKL